MRLDFISNKWLLSYFCSIVFLLMISCRKDIIIYDGDFRSVYESSSREGKYLCVFLGGGKNCSSCQEMIKTLEKENILSHYSKKYNFLDCNVADERNAFLLHLFLMEAIPNLYIFNPRGELVYYRFHSVTASEIEQIFSSLLDDKKLICPKNHLFKSSPDKLLKMHNFLLQGILKLHAVQQDSLSLNYVQSIVNESINIEPYFYNLYIKSMLLQQQNLVDSAQKSALLALSMCQSDFHQAVYDSLVNNLNHLILHLDLQNSQQPVISFDTLEINCGNIEMKKEYNYVFNFQNKGNMPLHILNVNSSCGCLKPEWDYNPILPNSKGNIKVSVELSDKGYFSRTFYVHSTGVPSMTTLRLYGSTY